MGAGELYEPGGLSVSGGDLYIADTNNHLLRRLDLTTGALATILVREATIAEPDEFFPALETIPVSEQTLTAQTPATLAVSLILPPGHHINTDAPNSQSLRVDGALSPLPAPSLSDGTISVSLGPLSAGRHAVRYTVTLYYCREGNETACAIKSLQWQVPLVVNGGGNAMCVPLTATLVAQD